MTVPFLRKTVVSIAILFALIVTAYGYSILPAWIEKLHNAQDFKFLNEWSGVMSDTTESLSFYQGHLEDHSIGLWYKLFMVCV